MPTRRPAEIASVQLSGREAVVHSGPPGVSGLAESVFRPAWWVPGAHLQTIWGKFFRRRSGVPTRTERWDTPDGDFVDLYRLDAAADRPRLLILHGLEGSPRSHYVAGLLALAHSRGWAADVLVFRSCGGEPNRLARSYHSGDTGDLDMVVRRLIAAEPTRQIVAAGVSLGGNVLLKWLGEQGQHAPAPLRAAAAISVPYDLARSVSHIDRGFARVYQWHFMRTLRRKAIAKAICFPDQLSARAAGAARSLREFDDAVTAPLHGFTSAEDYYSRSSSLDFLTGIAVPTLLLSARDDPFLPPAVLDQVAVTAAGNSRLRCLFAQHGGHAGFIGGRVPWRPDYFAERCVVDFLGQWVGDAAADRAEIGPRRV